ncbi:MAG: phosphonate ABC transporter ATP-binding protein [Sphingomonas sp.]
MTPHGDADHQAMLAPDVPLLVLDRVATLPPGAQQPILAGVSFVVGPGECLALIGPSGSGKTTLLRTINAAIPPSAGAVRFQGMDLTSVRGPALRAIRSRIGVIAQRHDLVERLRVDRNVMAGALGRWSNARALRYLLHPRADELAEARDALAAVGIAEVLRRRTSALSGGEQQRVAIARALVQGPDLLLADEPVASLDPVKAVEVMTLLTGLARSRGMALITSLHQHDLAKRFCDRVLELRGGTIAEQAPGDGDRPQTSG